MAKTYEIWPIDKEYSYPTVKLTCWTLQGDHEGRAIYGLELTLSNDWHKQLWRL